MGLRTGELIGLKWSDIDWEKRVVHIQRSMEYRYSVGEWRIGEPKSKSGYRDVPLTEEAIAILKRQKEKLREIEVINMQFKEHVFPHTSHTKIRHTTRNYATLGIWKRFFQFSGSLLIKRDTSSAIWHSDAL